MSSSSTFYCVCIYEVVHHYVSYLLTTGNDIHMN